MPRRNAYLLDLGAAAGQPDGRALRVGDDRDAQVLSGIQRSAEDTTAGLPERVRRAIDVGDHDVRQPLCRGGVAVALT
jgi:hypothetical protein